MYCSNCGGENDDSVVFCSHCGKSPNEVATSEVIISEEQKINRMERVALSGGLIGLLTTNPRAALERKIMQLNAKGWRCHQIMDHSTRNTFIMFLQFLILICTLGLWTFGSGYLLLFEKKQ